MKNRIHQKNGSGNEKMEYVTEEFSGKNLTRFGGAGLIRRFFQRHGVKKAIEKEIRVDGRRESRYGVGAMLMSILYGVFLGYHRPGQMEVLRTDAVFQKIAGLSGFPAQSTMSRFLSALRICVAREISALNFKLLMRFRKGFKAGRAITLDLDSHVTTVHGNQQRAGVGYNPKKRGRKSYHPLLCFIGETRDYIGGVLRSGRRHTSHNAVSFLKGIMKNLPGHIEKVRLRADGGFFGIDMLKFLLKRSVEFYVVVPMQPWVQRKIKHMTDWKAVDRGTSAAECEYVVAKGKSIRMVVIRQRVRAGEEPRKQLTLLNAEDVAYDYQVIATNSEKAPEEVWRFYNRRACCENFIKEGIYGFGLDKVVSHSWAGNYTWFELLMLGYNLMNFFKEEALGQSKAKEMVQTIRDRLFSSRTG